MQLDTLIIVAVLIAGFGVLYWLLKRSVNQHSDPRQMENMVNQIFGMSAQKIVEQSRQVLGSEKEVIRVDLENKHRSMEELVKQLQADLKTRQDEIRLLEQDRTRKFGELTTAIEGHRQITDQLSITTQQLAKVLSNNQTRGEWGERIIEDLLRSNGLMEGVHYLRQSKQIEGSGRPDITLLLPNDRNVPVDVKFPYAAIQKMSLAQDPVVKASFVKQFEQDVRVKINKVALYIDPSQNTLDYAILFVPNEMIFSFINQEFPELIDEAIGKRVLIVSPFTFLIVARTVIESYRNFMIGDKLKDVVKAVDEFTKEWVVFKGKFEKYGRSLDTLKGDYEELTGTRVRQMEKRLVKIDKLRQGSLIEELEDAEETDKIEAGL